jgi:hypothetical protein
MVPCMNRRSFLGLAPVLLLADELPSPRRVYSFIRRPVTLQSTMDVLKQLYTPEAVERAFISSVDRERGIITVSTPWHIKRDSKGQAAGDSNQAALNARSPTAAPAEAVACGHAASPGSSGVRGV